MDERIFGLRNQYSVVLSASGPRQLSPHEVLSPQEVRRRLFGPVVSGGLSRSMPLRNGGQLYLDVVGHPEYATPDCGNALDLVVHDKAGERILEGLLEDAGSGCAKRASPATSRCSRATPTRRAAPTAAKGTT